MASLYLVRAYFDTTDSPRLHCVCVTDLVVGNGSTIAQGASSMEGEALWAFSDCMMTADGSSSLGSELAPLKGIRRLFTFCHLQDT